jgi:hypothetical protein
VARVRSFSPFSKDFQGNGDRRYDQGRTQPEDHSKIQLDGSRFNFNLKHIVFSTLGCRYLPSGIDHRHFHVDSSKLFLQKISLSTPFPLATPDAQGSGNTGNLNWRIQMFMLKRAILAVVATVAVGVALTGSAQASDTYCPPGYVLKRVVTCETVTCYQTQRVSYVVCVTRYDYCGVAYTVNETRYRDVQVPVQKTVNVTRYVAGPAY